MQSLSMIRILAQIKWKLAAKIYLNTLKLLVLLSPVLL